MNHPDPGVDETVYEVDREADPRDHDGPNQYPILENRIIALDRRLDDQFTDASQRENSFHQHHGRHKTGHLESKDRYDRYRRIAEGMFADHDLLRQTFGVSGSNVIGV